MSSKIAAKKAPAKNPVAAEPVVEKAPVVMEPRRVPYFNDGDGHLAPLLRPASIEEVAYVMEKGPDFSDHWDTSLPLYTLVLVHKCEEGRTLARSAFQLPHYVASMIEEGNETAFQLLAYLMDANLVKGARIPTPSDYVW